MKILRISVLLIILGWWPSQIKPQIVPPVEIYVPHVIDKKIRLNLSDLFPEYSYTLLETKEGAYIGKIDMLFMDKDLILVYDEHSNKLLRFTKSGGFVGEFMKYGKGPGEFFEIRSIDGMGNGELLVLKNGQYIDIMNYAGNIINTIKLPATPGFARWVNPGVIALFYPYPRYFHNEGCEITFVDRNGNVLSKGLKHGLKDTGSGYGTTTYCQRNNGSLYYWNPQTDTVYTISQTREVYPRYILTHNRRHSDAMKVRTVDDSPSLDGKYIVESFYEWGDFMFLSGANNLIVYLGLINGKKNLSGDINYDRDKRTWLGLLNDVDGGMPFWPGTNQPDGSITKVIDASQLFEIVKHNQKTGLKVDTGKQAKFQKEVLGRLTEMSNPVIMRIAN